MYVSYGKPSQRQKNYKTAPDLTESIYNLIQTAEVRQEKPIRYKSIHSNSVKEFYESQKLPHRTMGSKSEHLSPKLFLKKHTRESKFDELQRRNKDAKLIESNLCNPPDRSLKKPPVPKHDERPVTLNASTTKNFMKENIRNVLRTVAKKPEPKVVDSPKGYVVILEDSGLVPKYLSKEEYGKTPHYLIVMKKEMEWSRKKYEEYMREQMEKGMPKMMSEDRKQELLAGLKKNWSETNSAYAGIPLLTDTIRKKANKEQLEEILKTLEKDIALLERHDMIYILDH